MDWESCDCNCNCEDVEGVLGPRREGRKRLCHGLRMASPMELD